MIVSSWSIVSWFVRNAALSSHMHDCLPGAFLMENINRPWVCLLSAGDWINWREQFLDVITFMELFHIASICLTNMLVTANIDWR